MADDGPKPDDAYFVPDGQGACRTLFPGVSIRANAGRSIMLSVVTFEPDALVPEHSHPHEQLGVMLSGRAEFTVGSVTRTLGPGDQWKIPGGVPHRVRAVGGPAVALDVFHPVREDYL